MPVSFAPAELTTPAQNIYPGMVSAPVKVTAPVKLGLATGASKFNAVCVALDIGLRRSVVLSTFASPTCVLVTPDTVPVKLGLAFGANKFSAVCVAEDTGLLASEVLLTRQRSA